MRVAKREFLGTYFDRDSVIKLSRILSTLAWVVAGIYALDLLIGLGTYLLQFVRGFMVGVGITDVAQSVVFLLERPVHGVVYFAVLQTLAAGILILLDVEDNTRGVPQPQGGSDAKVKSEPMSLH
jgi:uncharacterized membrane protein SpoIIM required for sporulation